MTTKENLAAALELLRTDGWVKGSLHAAPESSDLDSSAPQKTYQDGSSQYGWCELGAVARVLHPGTDPTRYGYDETPEVCRLAAAIGQLYPSPRAPFALDIPASVAAVGSFNDAYRTTWDMVERAFLTAMDLSDEDGR